ncbi:M1 family metallopeptidase [Algibacter amylolyticus]|uniref:M1 family metallopeptidase n=1 Tax=Algibacter amylolyticus TaxID=1608400 RepID=A0A5M7B844_9FLAO|nr:M1 family metallopeptidase [Algibacter amylolyticus]KAA5823591.1 M1 family metallopeptidase [Algibacter amylolyticus]MBB5267749.1 hypothetical protein [Algibacter amylolyticus]TSJ74079.1 M1 family metallopeptidase [Algibacter amylolyticus]
MKKYQLLLIVFISLNLYSQKNLYIPIEFQKAYKSNTRSADGKPGNHYWQNFSSYAIKAAIEPETWKIKGSEVIEYTNNSPDTLTAIYIKLYPNHYKKGVPRANLVPIEDLTDGVQITNLKINNTAFNVNKSSQITVLGTYIIVHLENGILPKSKALISMDWTTEMPPIHVDRIGAYDSSSAFVGYWYPQIARYDDIDGWDMMEFMGSQETNNDFSDFNVTIEVPDTYTIWATGILQNPEAVFTPEVLQRYNTAKTTEEPITILTGGTPINSAKGTKNEWHFKAEYVPDFAFGVSNTFRWIGNTVTIENNKIASNLVFDPSKADAISYLINAQKKSFEYLSMVYPKEMYPYPQFTTFIGVPGFNGMEFPMMANNGVSDKDFENTDVTFHELAHSYFPFLMGINEVKYSWMEEGWATFFTIKFIQEYYKNTPKEDAELNRNLNSYNANAGNIWDVPLITPSYLLTFSSAHSQLSYRKPAFMYFTLEHLLGEEIFKSCLKTYIERWKGKHPTPYDFMFTFNDVSNTNLNWFWNKWVFENGYGDLGIVKFENSKVYIQNFGGLPLPVFLKLTYKNGKQVSIEKKADIWMNNNENIAEIEILDIDNLIEIKLIDTNYPDAVKKNNLFKL